MQIQGRHIKTLQNTIPFYIFKHILSSINNPEKLINTVKVYSELLFTMMINVKLGSINVANVISLSSHQMDTIHQQTKVLKARTI